MGSVVFRAATHRQGLRCRLYVEAELSVPDLLSVARVSSSLAGHSVVDPPVQMPSLANRPGPFFAGAPVRNLDAEPLRSAGHGTGASPRDSRPARCAFLDVATQTGGTDARALQHDPVRVDARHLLCSVVPRQEPGLACATRSHPQAPCTATGPVAGNRSLRQAAF